VRQARLRSLRAVWMRGFRALVIEGVSGAPT
jgi:hypothetical protein